MMAMKRMKFILIPAMVIMPSLMKGVETEQVETYSTIVNTPDTILKQDTIVIKEIITRTDVIHRTEKVVRREESLSGSGSKIIRGIPRIKESGEKEITEPDAITETTEVVVAESISDNNGGELFPDVPLGGKFIWVPDSMRSKVNTLLANGNLTTKIEVNTDEETVDLNEKVVFRGDTINMILKDRNLGRYDRGLFNYLFIPKGIWQIGLTASYGEFSTSDLEILDLISDIDFSGKLWSIRPYFQYFLRSNISLGLRLGYTQGRANIGSFNVDIDEDMSFKLHDIMYKSNSYSASFTFSQYLGIARKGRFGVFNEVELALSGGDSDFNRPFNGELRKTHTQMFQAALNFSPGVCVYVLDQVSFNVSLGVFGLNIKHEKQKVNDEDLGWRTTSGANFRFNIFNINFGIAVNI